MIWKFLQNKKLFLAFKTLVAFVLVLWLIYFVNWQEVWQNVTSINLLYIVFFVVLFVTGLTISSQKWRVLAHFRGFSGSLRTFFEWYLIGAFVNNFMPSFIGGDAYRIYALGKVSRRFRESSSTVVIDRLTGFFSVILLTLIFAIFNWELAQKYHILLTIYILFLFFAISLMLLLKADRSIPFGKKLFEKLPHLIQKYLGELGNYRSKNILTTSILYAIAFSFVGIASTNYLLFVAVGSTPHILNFLGVIFLISIISAIPISIGNIGIKEWAYIFFFGFLGISASTAITVVLLSRFLQMIVTFFALPLYLRNKKDLARDKIASKLP